MTECPNLAIVEYHSLDDYSNVYSDARVMYYDVVYFPNSRIDGIAQPNWSSYQAYLQAYEDRMDQSTNYSLAIQIEGDGSNFTGSVNVGWLNANNENKVLHLVLTESHIPESWYGGEEVNWVTRLMIPDQFGTPLASGKGPDALFDFSFVLDPDWVKDSCELVAFVQDTVTMEIFQGNSILMAEVEITNYDIAIESIEYPGDEHCGETLSPIIRMKNLCHEPLTSCSIAYVVNGDDHEYNWVGSLETDSVEMISLPDVDLDLMDDNSITVNLSMPNGEEDQDPENNTLQKNFLKAGVIPTSQLVLELLTDDLGQETEWVLTNGTGGVVDQGGPYESNSLYTIEWDLSIDDCYSFTIMDSGGDGICCENGNGYYRIRDQEGTIYFEGDEFEAEDQVLFQLDTPTRIDDSIQETGFGIFPNPASDKLYIRTDYEIIDVVIYNLTGQIVCHESLGLKSSVINIKALESGLYLVQVNTISGSLVERLIVR